ncbi:ABC transporter permease subunit, partial [Escherichia coli]|nr:ABC transporter permease subunit [Escherichia coli]
GAHYSLPGFCCVWFTRGGVVRCTPPSVLEGLGGEYISTAVAQGLPRLRVIIVRAVLNAMLPVVTVIGLQGGTLLAGAVLAQTILSRPGLGRGLFDRLQPPRLPGGQAGRFAGGAVIHF